MNSPVAPASSTKTQNRLARWMLLGLLLLITPLVLVGVGVASLFRLGGDAAFLRGEVMTATDSNWNTKVQVSAGWCTLTTARTVMRFVQHEHQDEARLALSAVRRVSVGVYERLGRGGEWSREQLFAETDRKMRDRGWSRLVGVVDGGATVLVYTSDDLGAGPLADVCVAVVDGDEMVVVSTKVDADKLLKLAERHLPKGGLREKLKHTQI
jgi:hypothetical protein